MKVRRAGLGFAKGFGAVVVAAGLALPALGAEQPVGTDARRDLTLTVYNQNLALVSEHRRVPFEAGENRIAILDVSARMQPQTVILSGPGLALIEQSFDANLITAEQLIERSLGGRVWVRRYSRADGTWHYFEAKLVSNAEGPIVLYDGRLESAGRGNLAFESDIEGLRARPTLFATMSSESAGEKELAISYLTGGIGWDADYVAELNTAENRLDLLGMITLSNHSGTGYAGARLRLVAGDVNIASLPQQDLSMTARAGSMEMARQVASQPIGDQYLYELDRRVTLSDRETKQVTLLSAEAVPLKKEYRFTGLVQAQGGAGEMGPVKATVRLEFENAEGGPLGRPLPAGIVRVYKQPGEARDGDSPVFLGEDRIGHVAVGEPVRLEIGRAFDVTGEARQTLFERVSDKTFEAGQEITIENAKADAIAVKVVGQMPHGWAWKILQESAPHELETANQPVWTLDVPAGGEAKLTYRARITRP